MNLVDGNKNYTLVYENKNGCDRLVSKRLVWDYLHTAKYNFKEFSERKFAGNKKGEPVYPKLRILEIDCSDPSKSKFVNVKA